jgi:hypothetical protein
MTTGVVKKTTFDQQSLALKCVWLVVATVAFLFCFYAGTAVMSIVFPLDAAPLAF